MEETKQKTPTGMIIIMILLGLGIVGNLYNLKTPMWQIGPMLITGPLAMAVMVIIAGILGLILFGIIKKAAWTPKLALGWFGFAILLSLINIISFKANEFMYDDAYQEILTPELAQFMTHDVIFISMISSMIISWIFGIIVIVYLMKKKDYFRN